MSNPDQNELLELYKAMTQADAEARKTRIEDAKALGVFFFACLVFVGLSVYLLVGW